MVDFFKDVSDRNGYSGIMVDSCDFWFRRGWNNVFECFTLNQNSSVEFGSFCDIWMVQEVKLTSNSTSFFWCYQIHSVAIDMQYYIAWLVPDERIWVRMEVFHELLGLMPTCSLYSPVNARSCNYWASVFSRPCMFLLLELLVTNLVNLRFSDLVLYSNCLLSIAPVCGRLI